MTSPNRLATRLAEISFLLFAMIFGAVFSVCSAQSLSIHHPTQAIKWYRPNDTGTLMAGIDTSLYQFNLKSKEQAAVVR